jgi:4'-phosphopantetheinyl transferase
MLRKEDGMVVDHGRQAAGAEVGAAPSVRIWKVDLRQPAAWVEEAAAALLEPDERGRSGRETPEASRRRRVARAALRIALSRWCGCPPEALKLVRGRHGKPTLADTGIGPVHFNVSRSGDCCLIAVTAIGPVGVDVERVAAFPELEAIVRSRFDAGESAAILRLRGDRRLRAFYNCWTRKEAYLKATGMGLTTGLDAVAVTVDDAQASILSLDDDDPDAWSLVAIRPAPDLIGALAVRGATQLSGQALEPIALPLEPEPRVRR